MPHRPRDEHGPNRWTDIEKEWLDNMNKPFPSDGGSVRNPAATASSGPFGFLFYLIGMPIALLVVYVAIQFTPKPEPIPERTLKSNLVKQHIESVGYGYNQSYLLPVSSRAAFDKTYTEMLKRQPKVIQCGYNEPGKEGSYRYEFWYGSMPDEARELVNMGVPKGHPLRTLGFGAISECPKVLKDAQDKISSFWSLLPPVAQR